MMKTRTKCPAPARAVLLAVLMCVVPACRHSNVTDDAGKGRPLGAPRESGVSPTAQSPAPEKGVAKSERTEPAILPAGRRGIAHYERDAPASVPADVLSIWGPLSHDVRMGLVCKRVYAQGERIVVNLWVENQSARDITLQSNPATPFYTMTIRKADGTPVAFTEKGNDWFALFGSEDGKSYRSSVMPRVHAGKSLVAAVDLSVFWAVGEVGEYSLDALMRIRGDPLMRIRARDTPGLFEWTVRGARFSIIAPK